MKEMSVFAGRLCVAATVLLLVNGCGLGPKKKVPPLVEMAPPPAPAEQPVAVSPPVVPPSPPPAPPGPDGMAGAIQPPAPAPRPGFDPALVAGMDDFVAGRINHYRDSQTQWQELEAGFSRQEFALPQPEKWQGCTTSLAAILDGYFALHALLKSEGDQAGEGQPAAPFAVLQHDISFLEGDCRTLFAAAAAVIPGQAASRGAVAGQADAAVRYWAGLGDNAQVINAYENMAAAGREEDVSPETREMYARALRATGKLAQAAEVLLAVAQGKEEWLAWPLRLQAAELLFATGEFRRAREQYAHVAALFSRVRQADGEVEKQLALLAGQEEHARELELYSRALLGWLQYDGQQVPPQLMESVQQLEAISSESVYARMGRELLAKAGGPAVRNAEDALMRARQLTEEKKFAEALELLAPYSQDTEPPETVLAVRELAEEIRRQQTEQGDMPQTEQQTEQQEALDAKWQKALQTLDERQYDQAIVLFAEFVDPAYQEQARVKIAEAENLAAAELRKEAASLFIKARKSANVEQKSALLMESRRLLLQVQEKYPQADIIDKVRQNQRAIEEQILTINPQLLNE